MKTRAVICMRASLSLSQPSTYSRLPHTCPRLKTISSYTAFSRLVLILRALHVNMDKVGSSGLCLWGSRQCPG